MKKLLMIPLLVVACGGKVTSDFPDASIDSGETADAGNPDHPACPASPCPLVPSGNCNAVSSLCQP